MNITDKSKFRLWNKLAHMTSMWYVTLFSYIKCFNCKSALSRSKDKTKCAD